MILYNWVAMYNIQGDGRLEGWRQFVRQTLAGACQFGSGEPWASRISA